MRFPDTQFVNYGNEFGDHLPLNDAFGDMNGRRRASTFQSTSRLHPVHEFTTVSPPESPDQFYSSAVQEGSMETESTWPSESYPLKHLTPEAREIYLQQVEEYAQTFENLNDDDSGEVFLPTNMDSSFDSRIYQDSVESDYLKSMLTPTFNDPLLAPQRALDI
jgi:hypothetical protein